MSPVSYLLGFHNIRCWLWPEPKQYYYYYNTSYLIIAFQLEYFAIIAGKWLLIMYTFCTHFPANFYLREKRHLFCEYLYYSYTSRKIMVFTVIRDNWICSSPGRCQGSGTMVLVGSQLLPWGFYYKKGVPAWLCVCVSIYSTYVYTYYTYCA